MGYHETDFNLCKKCWVQLKKPSKRSVKRMEATMYKDKCENCGMIDRLVDYIWDDDEDNENVE
jgi:RNase P subunit RPR2